MQKLIVPLQHHDLSHTPMDEVLISYEENWPKIHYRSFMSSYSNTPFFDYFSDDFRELLEKKQERLIDLNLSSMNFLFKCFQLKIKIDRTTEYTPFTAHDFRSLFHPKKENEAALKYRQVFEEKNGFISNVSSLDLLFNHGNRINLK